MQGGALICRFEPTIRGGGRGGNSGATVTRRTQREADTQTSVRPHASIDFNARAGMLEAPSSDGV